MDDPDVTQTLDARGLNCPLPVLKTKKALDGIEPGQILEVISTDPGSRSDMAVLVQRLGHELLQTKESGGEISFFIRKKE